MKKRQGVMRRDQIWGRTRNDSTNGGHGPRYLECQKNHAASIGGYAVDGCREFMGSGPEGTSNALVCAACGCHRNFHRKVRELDEAHEVVCESSSPPSSNS